MCGILGFVGQINKNNRVEVFELITEIFNETEVRGKHASGYASLVNKGKNVSYSKMPVRSTMFTDHDIYYNQMWYKNPSMFIGHCRYATSGKPEINKNNHPFSANNGNLWMIHNGTCCGLKNEVPNNLVKSECDSEYILRLVEKDGWDIGIKKVVNSNANFALMFLDKTENKLKFIRNDARPLYLIDAIKQYGVYILCSTIEIFKSACKTLSLKHKNFKKYNIKTNTLYEIDSKSLTITKNKIKKKQIQLVNTNNTKPIFNNYLDSKRNDSFWNDYEYNGKRFAKKKYKTDVSYYVDSNGLVETIRK